MAAYTGALFIILHSMLPFMRKKEEHGPVAHAGGEEPKPEEPEIDVLRRRLSLYKKIIDRYRDIIETEEDKSVTELRTLIDPENPVIRNVMGELLHDFRPYLYDKDFAKAAELAYEYCRREIKSEFLPVDFWLTPEDIVELKAADEIDKAIFLCSLLLALENQTAKVVVESEGRNRHAYVTFEYNGKFCLMDPTHEVYATGPREKVIRENVKDADRKLIYEFNDKEYGEW